MLIDEIATMLAAAYDCPCNYASPQGMGLAEILLQRHDEEWFAEHCKPELDGAAVTCWKEILLSMTKRIDKDTYYLNIARAVAQRSTCLHRQYGAVIVNNDEIIATGYNGSPRGEQNCCDAGACYKDSHDFPRDQKASVHGKQYGSCVAVHAEQNAIISAARKDMQGATLYLASLDPEIVPAPCNFCDRMIKNAGIVRVVTG
jgi:dCMP deaminase